MHPSLKIKMRSAKLAAYALCVTINIVVLRASFDSFKVFSKSVAELESNAPVGSSANRILGRFTMVLKAEARCLCPPESSFGYLLSCGSMPNASARLRTMFSIFFGGSFCRVSGTAIFSKMVRLSSRRYS